MFKLAKANHAYQIYLSTACYSKNDLQCLICSFFFFAFMPFSVFSKACIQSPLNVLHFSNCLPFPPKITKR